MAVCLAVPLLLGMGLDEFSTHAVAIPAIKQAITQLTIPEVQAIVADALHRESSESVRHYVAERFPHLA